MVEAAGVEYASPPKTKTIDTQGFPLKKQSFQTFRNNPINPTSPTNSTIISKFYQYSTRVTFWHPALSQYIK